MPSLGSAPVGSLDRPTMRRFVGPTKNYPGAMCPCHPSSATNWRGIWPSGRSAPTNSSSRVSRPDPSGTISSHDGCSSRVRAAGVPDGFRFHDLWHTYAAFCIASTADPYAVMRRMGHSSITVTYNMYGHLFPERDRRSHRKSGESSTGRCGLCADSERSPEDTEST